MSVVERIYERIQAFDTATVGTTQLIHKAHLRTYSIDGLRKILATGGTLEDGLMKHMDMIREFQTIEGMTIMDKSDEFQTHSYSFAGIADVILRFAEQVSGATGIPLVRLFGQSPSGFSTGDGDLENYYSRVNSLQERRLRRHIRWLLDISWRSCSDSPCRKTSPSSSTSSGRCRTLTGRQWPATWPPPWRLPCATSVCRSMPR